MDRNYIDEVGMLDPNIDDKSSPLVAKTDGNNANGSGDNDDDFFESLRMRQSTNDEDSRAEKPSETMVDSTPTMMVLDTLHNKNDDIPDLTLNISPTSFSITSSEESSGDDEILASDSTSFSACSTTSSKSGLFFKLVFVVLGLFSSAFLLANKEQTKEKFNISSLTVSGYNLNSFPLIEAERMIFDIFQWFQDTNEKPHYDDSFEKAEEENRNHTTFSEEEERIEQIGQQQSKLLHLSTSCQMTEASTSEIQATELLQHQMEVNVVQKRGPKKPMSQRVLRTRNRRPNTIRRGNYIYKKTIGPSPKTSVAPTSKLFALAIVQKVQRLREQLANALVTYAANLADYLNLSAKNAKFRMHHDMNYVVDGLNAVMKNLASQNEEIQVGRQSMVEGRESLVHIGAATKQLISKIDDQISDIAQGWNKMTKDLASTNVKIQGNNFEMIGVRESFTKIGAIVRRRTSRIVSRRLKITSIRF